MGEIGPLTAAVATTAASTLATLFAVLINLSDGQLGTRAISDDSNGIWVDFKVVLGVGGSMDGLGRHSLVISSGAITFTEAEGKDGECSTLRGGVSNHGEAGR